ncbi:response regulator transcription factor [Altererythrobacter sp.]|uniref:response regulator transcription factor n=1 Tax=Altererythrobacter sp. TaxID=1872480 RepID=UPI003D0BA3AD
MVDLRELELTERQRAVAKSLVRRTPYKVIAADLGIAESTVNDHIRALRRKFDANSTRELVETLLDTDLAGTGYPQFGGETKNRVERFGVFGEFPARNDEYLLADSASVFTDAASIWPSEPLVVPEELDGPDAIWPRLQAIVKTISLILIVVVLTVAALNGINSLVLQN